MNRPPTIVVSRLARVLAGLILVISLTIPQPAAVAAPVTARQASTAVVGWLRLDPKPLGESLSGSLQRVETFSDNAGNALFYVVYLDPSGFVIVAADDLVDPIAGFASAGTFDASENNPLGALVENDLSARVAYARQPAGAAADAKAKSVQAKWQQLDALAGETGSPAKRLATTSDVRIAPLTQSTWDQGTAAGAGSTACYNYYTPPYGDGNTANYPAGCVATAMAQFMRYYQFPSAGVGSAGFSIKSDSSPLTYNLHGGDGAGGPYVWGNMPLVPPSNPTPAQCQAIGALVADAGATVAMSYTASGSGASLSAAKNALVSTFQYASAKYGWKNNADVGSGLIAMINPNLDAHCPVLLSITDSSVGHAVVADGYGYSASTLYHHLNLGWSGSSSAWYALPIIDTGYYSFTAVTGCAYNVYTNGSGEIISGRVLDQVARPVASATVTATRTGGGTYTTATDSQGIYALARIPSSSSYSITVSKASYSPASTNVSTGSSSDWSASTGNRWGVDLTLSMLPTSVDHLAWGAIAATQSCNLPIGVTIMALNATNGAAAGFSGPVALSAYTSGLGSSATIIGNASWNSYLSGSEMTHGYAFTPTTNLLVTAVRSFSSDKVCLWTDTGTLLGSQTTSSSGSWIETTLATPVTLSAGTAYRVSAHIPSGVRGYYKTSAWPTTFANGTVSQNFYWAYGDVFPTSVYGSAQGPLVDLRYSVTFSNSIPISPTSSSSFVSGVWSGSVAASQNATNVVLKADDGAGHTALSLPFSLITPFGLFSPLRPIGGQFQCTVASGPGQRLEILTSSNLVDWTSIAILTNNTGMTNFVDSAASLSRRFYRIHQLP